MDYMFANAINKSLCSITLKRLESGKYLFGSKFITTLLVDGELFVRTETGMLPVETFIEKY